MITTLTMDDYAEALYYVYMLPRKVKVITNCGPLFSALKLVGDVHEVSFELRPHRSLLRHNKRYIVGSNMPYVYKPDAVVNRTTHRSPRSKLFPDRCALLQYIEESVNPGVTLATQDEELLQVLGSLRSDVWITADVNDPLAIHIVVGSPLATDLMEVKWYVL